MFSFLGLNFLFRYNSSRKFYISLQTNEVLYIYHILLSIHLVSLLFSICFPTWLINSFAIQTFLNFIMSHLSFVDLRFWVLFRNFLLVSLYCCTPCIFSFNIFVVSDSYTEIPQSIWTWFIYRVGDKDLIPFFYRPIPGFSAPLLEVAVLCTV